MAKGTNIRLGQRLAALRRSAGLTQEDAATKAKIATETLSRIERNSQEVRLENLERLATVYGVSMADIFKSTGVESPSTTDILVQEITDLLRRQKPAALQQARKVLYALFDEEPPPLRVRRGTKKKQKKVNTG